MPKINLRFLKRLKNANGKIQNYLQTFSKTKSSQRAKQIKRTKEREKERTRKKFVPFSTQTILLNINSTFPFKSFHQNLETDRRDRKEVEKLDSRRFIERIIEEKRRKRKETGGIQSVGHLLEGFVPKRGNSICKIARGAGMIRGEEDSSLCRG